MRWEDERYVRVYTRDTVGWGMLPWQARTVLLLVMRKLDRAGILDLGGHGLLGISAIIGVPLEVVEPGVSALLSAGVFTMSDQALIMPNFMEAQECVHTDAQRQRESRARRRAAGLTRVQTEGADAWVNGDSGSTQVTAGHSESQKVTPNRAVPSLAVPSRAEPPRSEPAKAPPAPGGLADAIESVFREERGHAYEWNRENEDALRSIQKHPDAEILRRWRIALKTPFPRCDTILTLVTKWNSYGSMPPTYEKPKDVRKGHLRAEDMKHSEVTGEVQF